LNLTSLDKYLKLAMENLKALTMAIARVLVRDVYLYKWGKLNLTSLDKYLKLAMESLKSLIMVISMVLMRDVY